MCQKKNHQANQSIDLLVQHEKNSVKNCYCAVKKKKKKINVPIKNEQNSVKNYHCAMKRKKRRKKPFCKIVNKFTNSMNKFVEKLSLCIEGKERTK